MQIAVLSKSFAKASDKPIKILEDAGFEVLIKPNHNPSEEQQVADLIGNCQGAIVSAQDRIGSLVFDQCRNLQVIADHGVGFDNIDMQGAAEYGIVVKTCPGNYESVADLTWLFILAASRNLIPAIMSVKEGNWSPQSFSGTEVLQKTIGVIGYGQIGRSVIQRSRGFSNRILAYDPFMESLEPIDGIMVEKVNLDELLQQSDVVTLHVPLTEGTVNLIDARALSLMKSSAILVNTSRGGLVDEEALYESLIKNKIKAAAMDVFETEPPGRHKLLERPNFIATPHIGAQTTDANIRMGTMAAAIIIEVLGNQNQKI